MHIGCRGDAHETGRPITVVPLHGREVGKGRDQLVCHKRLPTLLIDPLRCPPLGRLGVPPEQSRVSHVLDGAHLERGRATWLKRGWPTLYNELVTVLPRLTDHS